VRWLTGSPVRRRAVVLPDELVLVTDGRYGEQARSSWTPPGVDGRVAVGRNLAAQLDLLVELVAGIGALGLEAEHVSWAAQQRLRPTPSAPSSWPRPGWWRACGW
jgi:hypothetical protein